MISQCLVESVVIDEILFFPTTWKMANIIPPPKCLKPSDLSHAHPITTPLAHSKVQIY